MKRYNVHFDNQIHKIKVDSLFPIKFANTILSQLPRTCFAVLVFHYPMWWPAKYSPPDPALCHVSVRADHAVRVGGPHVQRHEALTTVQLINLNTDVPYHVPKFYKGKICKVRQEGWGIFIFWPLSQASFHRQRQKMLSRYMRPISRGLSTTSIHLLLMGSHLLLSRPPGHVTLWNETKCSCLG